MKNQDSITPSNIITLTAMAPSKSELGEILDKESKMIINKFRDTIAKRNTEGGRWNKEEFDKKKETLKKKQPEMPDVSTIVSKIK